MAFLSLSGLFLLTIITPIFFWIWFLRVCDRSEPEAKKNLLRVFFIGFGSAIFAAAVEATVFSLLKLDQSDAAIRTAEAAGQGLSIALAIIAGLIIAAAIEELIKAGAFWEFIYPQTYFNQIADGVFYAMALALGFSVMENILYFFALSQTLDPASFAAVALLRSIASTFIHLSCAGLTGLGLAKRKFSPNHSTLNAWGYIILGIFLHFLFNISLMITMGTWVAFLISFISLLLVFRILNQPDSRWVWRRSLNKPNN